MSSEYEYIRERFNEVEGITAMCRTNVHWSRGSMPELEVGRVYHVTHLGIQRSDTLLIVSEIPDRHYSRYMFDLYKDGEPFIIKRQDPRYLAPYLRPRLRVANPWNDGTPLAERLPAHIRKLEGTYGIKVLLAMEGGSRAWGFASMNSDWDVRFIYRYVDSTRSDCALSGKVIEHVFNDETDMLGWEEDKAMASLEESDLPVYEWLCVPAVYEADRKFTQAIKAKANECFDPTKIIRQYINIYIKNNEEDANEDNFSYKTFLYYLRGILACKWIMKEKAMPPVLLDDLVLATVNSADLVDRIRKTVTLKKKDFDYNSVYDKELISSVRDIYSNFLTEHPEYKS